VEQTCQERTEDSFSVAPHAQDKCAEEHATLAGMAAYTTQRASTSCGWLAAMWRATQARVLQVGLPYHAGRLRPASIDEKDTGSVGVLMYNPLWGLSLRVSGSQCH
jgi:hypothetical protein